MTQLKDTACHLHWEPDRKGSFSANLTVSGFGVQKGPFQKCPQVDGCGAAILLCSGLRGFDAKAVLRMMGKLAHCKFKVLHPVPPWERLEQPWNSTSGGKKCSPAAPWHCFSHTAGWTSSSDARTPHIPWQTVGYSACSPHYSNWCDAAAETKATHTNVMSQHEYTLSRVTAQSVWNLLY